MGREIEFEAIRLAIMVHSFEQPRGWPNPYVFPLVIRLAKGERLDLAPIILVLFFID